MPLKLSGDLTKNIKQCQQPCSDEENWIAQKQLSIVNTCRKTDGAFFPVNSEYETPYVSRWVASDL